MPHRRVVAALNYRMSGREVLDFVERYYVAETCDPNELVAYAKNRKDLAYPAEFHRTGGVAWEGRIQCGHNPWLEARIVDDLRSERSDGNFVELKWSERQIPTNMASI